MQATEDACSKPAIATNRMWSLLAAARLHARPWRLQPGPAQPRSRLFRGSARGTHNLPRKQRMAWEWRQSRAVPCRWILPFSRQFTVTALTYVPLVPWRLKMVVVQLYLRTCFYSPARLSHVAPAEATDGMDYTGAQALPPAHDISVPFARVEGPSLAGVTLASASWLRGQASAMTRSSS